MDAEPPRPVFRTTPGEPALVGQKITRLTLSRASGLVFNCPVCGGEMHRVSNTSQEFTPPMRHTVRRTKFTSSKWQIHCWAVGFNEVWLLAFDW